jgi:predicted phosphodiesterase
MASQERGVRIAVIGDVHDQWEPQDAIALHHLQVDLVLLVGDFGNESLTVVQQIADLDLPKAVILGNHDAWYTATPWAAKSAPTIAPAKIGCKPNSTCWDLSMWAMANWISPS